MASDNSPPIPGPDKFVGDVGITCRSQSEDNLFAIGEELFGFSRI
jgi:hypothetical protein